MSSTLRKFPSFTSHTHKTNRRLSANNRSRTLEAYASAAADVSRAETPDSIRGGVFEASSASGSGGSSSTPSGSAATPASSTGAGASIMGQGAGVAGVVAMIAGLWGL